MYGSRISIVFSWALSLVSQISILHWHISCQCPVKLDLKVELLTIPLLYRFQAAANCRALGARTGLPRRADPRLAPFLH